jgi:hypothetical protein
LGHVGQIDAAFSADRTCHEARVSASIKGVRDLKREIEL